ncbi:MAG: alkaline phosphatase D family protein [Gemmataceae bacterium]|nr:alkaline phosphatase D family protein [Gemmataceae bacterium]
MQRSHLFIVAALLGVFPLPAAAQEFSASFANTHDRIWVGPTLWANPMEDWQIRGGRLECLSAGPNRNVHALTAELLRKHGTFSTSVLVGRLDESQLKGSVGFRVGIQDEIDDYRARLLYGTGLNAGVTTEGELFIGEGKTKAAVAPAALSKGLFLRLDAERGKGEQYTVTLKAIAPDSGKELAHVTASVAAERLYGNLALVNNHPGIVPGGKKGKKGMAEGQGARFWFNDWKISGTKVANHPERAFGPVLWAMHTLSRGVLKMTAQMPPIGKDEPQTVRLQIRGSKGWMTVAEEKIDPLARTATFRVPKWDDTRDVPYLLAYVLVGKDGRKDVVTYRGTVRRDPIHKDTLVVAGLSCNADYCFPNREIVRNLTHHNPDLLFFAGDQIYEYVGGYPLIRTPVDRACLNYLRKWYLFGVAFGELMRDRPTVCIPDDHDVYQGNIWGNGGNPVSLAEHARGGYVQHRDFVNVVHRTQTSNLPDPFDPTPIKQTISVYYCDLVYGRVGFAVLADRMFKSGPEGTVATWKGRPDHLKDPKVDVKSLDKPGLHLLGERQEKFLSQWTADWKGVDMKCVLSQTPFCNVADYHGGKDEYLIADLDSGGWPQSGRNRAVDLMRRAFALHLSGDQHLTTLVHYGIERQGDSNVSFCVPAIANFYPRRWQPDKEGVAVKNRPAGGLPNTGDYLDGLKNSIRVLAVGNPQEKYRAGRLASLHDKASGYGIVRFHRKDGTITLESWRLLADATKPTKADQFPGWPRTIRMTDNYGRKPAGHLPEVRVKGMSNPVVQVIDQANNEVVYTLRVRGDRFRPMVFRPGRYTLKVGELGTAQVREFRGVQPTDDPRAVLEAMLPAP